MSKLFSPIQIGNLILRNRILMSPMCQYSAKNDGIAMPWHLVHYGARASGGAGLVLTEATAVSADGRISEQDLGLWNNQQVEALKPVVQFVKSQGAAIGIQLAHAGRKGVSPQKFDPSQMSVELLNSIKKEFCHSAQLSIQAGFDIIEMHAAHGYLLHTFLSPISNKRVDQYGGSLENRMKYPIEVIQAVKNIWPQNKAFFVRLSATDWVDGGWDLSQSIEFVKKLKSIGVHLIDCSSGGLVQDAKILVGPGYQVEFAKAIKQEANILTGAVGMITNAKQAEQIIEQESADVIFLGRELLRNPHWPLYAAKELGVETQWPQQYLRAKL